MQRITRKLKQDGIGLALCALYIVALLVVHAYVPPALRLW